jgi:hypothetical protein
MDMQAIKTSIVVVSKNDDYGGNLDIRASYAINTMLQNYDEVVYVDWCSEKESLIESIYLDKSKSGKLNHIQVTKDDLNQINPNLLRFPIVEVLGRNIGIRRARGEWIVSSNIDIMPDAPEFPQNIQNMVAVARRNVPVEYFMKNMKHEDLFSFLKQNKTTLHQSERIHGNWSGHQDPWSLVHNCGDFQMAHRNLWEKMKGFEEDLVYRNYADTNVMKKASIYGEGAVLHDMDIFHLDHSGHSLIVDGHSLHNNWRSVLEFEKTSNSESWGYSDYDFKQEII